MVIASDAAVDRIQSIRGTANWSENLVFQVTDPSAGISVWAHWGRVPGHPQIWEGILTCYLPGGELLTSRGFGSSESADTAASGQARARCVEPLRRWTVEFSGMALRTSSSDVAQGPVADGEMEFLDVALEFVGLHPVWSAGDHMTGADWANCHLEQGGHFTGTVRHRDGEALIDAAGFRDHSHGPRDFSTLLADTWVTAVFPSGGALSALQVWTLSGQTAQMGFVWDGAAMHDVTAVSLPQLAEPGGKPHRTEATITTATSTEMCHVLSTHGMNYTFAEPAGMVLGTTRNKKVVVTEAPADVTWRGERGAGWCEKNFRLDLP